jgi:pyruvate dehydrogenase E2 component (dihydrolipoamide acetyltransferase)
MFGLDEGYVPPTPFARVPVYILVGAVRERAVVKDGQCVPQQQLTITATIDHRFIDGAQLGTLAKIIREILENPASLEAAATA